MGVGCGVVRSLIGNTEINVDFIPVDFVCNTLITAAWSNSFIKSKTIPVYHSSSGQLNPVKMTYMAETFRKYSTIYPTKNILWRPSYSYTTNISVHCIKQILYHFLPALIYDMVLRMQNKKPFMFRMAQRYQGDAEMGTFFTMHQWNFDGKNICSLLKVAKDTQLDANEFNFDISGLDWNEYFKQYWLGIRKFIFKEDLSSLPQARKKLQQFIWMSRIIQMIFISLGAYYLFETFKHFFT